MTPAWAVTLQAAVLGTWETDVLLPAGAGRVLAHAQHIHAGNVRAKGEKGMGKPSKAKPG